MRNRELFDSRSWSLFRASDSERLPKFGGSSKIDLEVNLFQRKFLDVLRSEILKNPAKFLSG